MEKNIKRIVIIIGLIITIQNIIQSLIKADFYIFNAIDYYFEDLIMGIILLEKKALQKIFGYILLIVGFFFIDTNEKKSLKIKQYQIFKIVGYIPFVGILCYGVFNMFFGYSGLSWGKPEYGISAFFYSIVFLSIFIWPTYIIGIFLILIGKNKQKKIKQENNKENNKI